MQGVWYDNVNKRWCVGFAQNPKLYLGDGDSRQSCVLKTSMTLPQIVVPTLGRAIGTIPLVGAKVGDIVLVQPRTALSTGIAAAFVGTTDTINIVLFNTMASTQMTQGIIWWDCVARRYE